MEGCYVQNRLHVSNIEEDRVHLSGAIQFLWILHKPNTMQYNAIQSSHTLQPSASQAVSLDYLHRFKGVQTTAVHKDSNGGVDCVVLSCGGSECTFSLPVLLNRCLFVGFEGEVQLDEVLFHLNNGVVHATYVYNGSIPFHQGT